MFDFGFPELIVIMAIAVFVIGPKEIPAMMVGLGRMLRRLQYLRYAFSQQFEDFMREHDLEDVHKQVNFESRAPQEHDFNEADHDGDMVRPLPETQKDDDGKDNQS